ncbi:hypothetical protein BH09VER1_BH09VER1_50980 [soil metagenome]
MKISPSIFALLLFSSFSLYAQDTPSAQSAPPFENPPILNASAILQPAYYQGTHFQVRNPVPTYAGANAYTIDSDFGVFQADGNDMLMRRVAEINAIAVLRQLSATKEFTAAAEKAVTSPLVAAQDLVTNPVGTISGVPKGIWKFLNQTGQSVKELGQGRQSDAAQGGPAANLLGFSKVKRQLALSLGVDPYSANPAFQKELNKVAWPAFAGGFVANLGVAVASAGLGTAGVALSSVSWSGHLNDLLLNNSPTDLRLLNLGLLLKMGVTRADANAFLNNNAFSPTTQTFLVDALAQLTSATGQAAFIQQATSSGDEQDALFYQKSAELMARLNTLQPITLIAQFNGLPICQDALGVVIIPIQWDYVSWTPSAAQFLAALKATKFPTPPTAYALVITGVVSPLSAQSLAAANVTVGQKQLATPLR